MISRVEKHTLLNVARLHIEAFPHYFFSQMGLKLIERFYHEFVGTNDIFLGSYSSDGSLNGFLLFVFRESAGRKNFIRKNFFSVALKYSILAILCNGVVWKKIVGKIKRVIFKKTIIVTNPKLPYILSICVNKKDRGKGVAEKLINELEKELIILGINQYKLTVRNDNHRAINFYYKMGFQHFTDKEHELVFVKKVSNERNS